MKKQHSELTKTHTLVRPDRRPGSESAGQSGDTQGLSDIEDVDSESVRELLEEGQSFEAEAIMAIENAPDPDVSEVHTRQVREDDVPPEYLERDDKP
jgi:hypothetical protein